MSWGIYEGNYKDSKANGYGRLIVKSDDFFAVYTGNFKDNVVNGYGTYVKSEIGKAPSTMKGTWTAAVLTDSPSNVKNEKTSIATIMKAVPTVYLKLTATVKSLSENMSKTPTIPTSIKVPP